MNAAEHELAELAATRRLTRATWVLCLVTVVLAVVTAMLAAATWAESTAQRHPPWQRHRRCIAGS
jgi:hypothetical protein